MIARNDLFEAVFGSSPFPMEYRISGGPKIRGVDENGSILINGEAFPLKATTTAREGGRFVLTAGEYELIFAADLSGSLKYTLSIGEKSKKVEVVNFSQLPFLRFGEDFSYARDRFTHQQWHSPIGPGLNRAAFETGAILKAWPEGGEPAVHACGFKDNICAFVRSEYAVAPLFVKFAPHEKYPQRSGSMALGLNNLYFDLKDRIFGSWKFAIHFIADMNGDGRADECDYQLELKKYLPQPCGIYKNAVWYKIMCATDGYTHTNFTQALEIIRYIHRITGGAKQIAYLVGWQDRGHDTNYPRFNIINPDVGTREEFIGLIREAKEKYNCTVSVHINVDDAYIGNPGWRGDIISRDTDGSLLAWEVFQQRQSYHINHTKDVRTGDIFSRIDEFLRLVPVTESIHVDAFRNTNSSWEADEFIGPDKEFYCGMLRIITHFNRRGLDVTTEALNGMVVEIAYAFSGLYHLPAIFPVLYQNQVYGGGCTGSPARVAKGSSINEDITYADFAGRTRLLRAVALRNMLYRYMLTKEMVEFRDGGISSHVYVRYADGTVARADDGFDFLEIVTEDGVLLADHTSRMIPLDGGLYVYQTDPGLFRRKLPRAFRNRPLRVRLLSECREPVGFDVDGDYLKVMLPADTLVFFEGTGE